MSSPAACSAARPTSCSVSCADAEIAGPSGHPHPPDDRRTARRPRSSSRVLASPTDPRPVTGAAEIPALVSHERSTVVAIDEAQFFDDGLSEIAGAPCVRGSHGRPVGPRSGLPGPPVRTDADAPRPGRRGHQADRHLHRLRRRGDRTQRLVGGRPAGRDDPLIVVGGLDDEKYEARCRAHRRHADQGRSSGYRLRHADAVARRDEYPSALPAGGLRAPSGFFGFGGRFRRLVSHEAPPASGGRRSAYGLRGRGPGIRRATIPVPALGFPDGR